jgi:hypothetical protein
LGSTVTIRLPRRLLLTGLVRHDGVMVTVLNHEGGHVRPHEIVSALMKSSIVCLYFTSKVSALMKNSTNHEGGHVRPHDFMSALMRIASILHQSTVR